MLLPDRRRGQARPIGSVTVNVEPSPSRLWTVDGAAMLCRDPLDQAETEPGAFGGGGTGRIGSEESLEHLLSIRRRQADARVLNVDPRRVALS